MAERDYAFHGLASKNFNLCYGFLSMLLLTANTLKQQRQPFPAAPVCVSVAV
jgi:hypothetical protein